MNRQMIFRRHPVGAVQDGDFELVTSPIPNLEEGEALIKIRWLSIDPTQRTWLNPTATYIEPVKIGEVMRGAGVGQVVGSRNSALPEGSWVAGLTGWQEFAIARSSGLLGLNVVPEGIEPRLMLSLFGANGLTAYFGMFDIGSPQTGETVLVSAAAGSTGSIAGQIAKLKGCRVIGVAGGEHKCRWLTDVAGFDASIDYQNESVSDRLKHLAPDGVDVMFDNVGGEVLEAALDNLAVSARIILCGSVSSGYEDKNYGAAPRNYMQLGFKRARMEGFIFLDYLARFPEAFASLSTWHAEGNLALTETIVDGLENAPSALRDLFEGRTRASN